MSELLKIKRLQVRYVSDEETVYAVNGIDFAIDRGETVGLVGETGAGKTTLALSIMGLLPPQVSRVPEGEILFEDADLLKASEADMEKIRGRRISMIFQDPMTSLNPTMKVGDQIREVLELHHPEMKREEMDAQVDEVLKMVGILPGRKEEYPYQFSGGMKQRIVIAIALVCEPELLIADEPTTALDVTIQAQILLLMRRLKNELNTAMMIITHDLGIVAEFCDKVAVVYCGEIIERGAIEEVFARTKNHPYTEGLFNCIPNLEESSARLTPIEGYIADPSKLPTGCKFADRCKFAADECREAVPLAYSVGGTHTIRCNRFKNGGDPA